MQRRHGTLRLQQAAALSAIFKLGRCVLWGPGGAPGDRLGEPGGSSSGGPIETSSSFRGGSWRLEAEPGRRAG